MPKKVTQETKQERLQDSAQINRIATEVDSKAINITSDNDAELKAESRAEAIVKEQGKTYTERIANHEGGEWIRYSKALAKRFGKAYKVVILPVTYSFQEGLRTFVLDEHKEHIWDIFDERLRAKGEEIKNSEIE